MAETIQSILNQIVEILVKEYQPEKIILFGSYAYGQPDEASDIDLFILKETEKSFPKRWAEVCELLAEVLGTTPFSPLVITPGELEERREVGDQFFGEIMTRGEVLYAR